MKIGLLMYANDFQFRGGLWRYSYNLARSLLRIDTKNEYSYIHAKKVPQNFGGLEGQELLLPMSRFGKFFFLPRLLSKSGFNVIHETANAVPFFRNESYRKILTLHDIMPLTHPQFVTPFAHLFFKWYLPRALHAVDVIIAPSQYTKEDIIENYAIDSSKISVIPEGVEEAFFTRVSQKIIDGFCKKYSIPSKYILFAGGVNPRRNIETLISAYALLPSEIHSAHHLVIAGGIGSGAQRIKDIVHECGITQYVHTIGYVSEENLPLLYGGANIFAFPSVYEGFGLPVVEAMAQGCPVIAANATSLPEVVGDAGILIDSKDIESWAFILERLIRDQSLWKELSEKGIRRARQFNWDSAAREHLKIYENV